MTSVFSQLKLLEARLDQLGQLILRDNLYNTSAVIQELSFAQCDSEYTPPFVAQTLSGRDAIKRAAEFFRTILKSEGQEPLAALRAVGIISVSNETIKLARKINWIKDRLKSQLVSLPRRQRQKIKNQYNPNLVLNQIYRHIAICSDSMETVNAVWTSSGTSSDIKSKEALLKELYMLLEVMQSSGKSADFIKADIQQISEYPDDHRFKVQRTTRPYTRYKVKVSDGGWQEYQGHSPLLISQTQAHYTPLNEFPPVPHKQVDGDFLIRWMGIME